jgi:hypothetical protein
MPLSVLFAALILVMDIRDWRLVANCLEVVVPVFCMGCSLFTYRYFPDRLILPLAAFAFFIYALTNTFWYLLSTYLTKEVYSSVAELGFFCFFIFFIIAFSIEFPDEGMRASTKLGIFALFLLIPVAYLWAGRGTDRVLLVLLLIQVLLTALLLSVTIRHGVFRQRLLFAGICLSCLFMTLYGVRETVIRATIGNDPRIGGTLIMALQGTGITSTSFWAYELMSIIIAPTIFCSFALIQLGLFSYLAKEPADAQGEIIPEQFHP